MIALIRDGGADEVVAEFADGVDQCVELALMYWPLARGLVPLFGEVRHHATHTVVLLLEDPAERYIRCVGLYEVVLGRVRQREDGRGGERGA